MRTRARIPLALVALVALAAACEPSHAALPVATPDRPSRALTTVAPAHPLGRPLRALVLGDSLMFDATPGIDAALRAGGAEVAAEPWLGMGLLRTDLYDWRARWPGLVEQVRPDVVVVLVGAWDLPPEGSADHDPMARAAALPGWRADLRAAALQAARVLTAHGATLIWVGMPWTRDRASVRQVSLLDAQYRAATTAVGGVYVDGPAVLGGPDHRYAETATVAPGVRVRLRKDDGVHICPEGAARLGDAVAAAAAARFGLRPAPGWRDARWRTNPRYSPALGCTPV